MGHLEEQDLAMLEPLFFKGYLHENNQHIWEMILPKRLRRMYDILNKRTEYVSVLTEAVDDGHNQAAILRSAEAFGVQNVHIVTGKHAFDPSRSISKSADSWLTLKKHRSIEGAIHELKRDGYQIIASNLSHDAVPVQEIDVSKPTVLMFGNEQSGISAKALDLSDQDFMIPMDGFMQSFNVSVAAALSLYEVTRRAKEQAGDQYFLDEERKKELYHQWMMKTLNPRVRKMVETGKMK
ncbi:tRNA (guanosine-2'-O-)-methyltransferase [Melghiribacillus thermohalophilus]|uniref:tRNA (guanosine(18)-2'-O)-methyltransferase n=1 Tax=Melghiribacillus thermohalophilus TaxID=1324956 RepID=A0A4R3NC54_9BACI|nr:tRNA (guanosine-2'-O-)-methyltransferase [Melghiribacillus thermohalophilus]